MRFKVNKYKQQNGINTQQTNTWSKTKIERNTRKGCEVC